MNVIWTALARRQLMSIHDSICRDSPHNAWPTIDSITRRAESVAETPDAGEFIPECLGFGSHSQMVRQISQSNYRIVYLARTDRIEILAVIDRATELPPLESLV